MIEKKMCINVWSDMNTWIDFCIIVADTVLEKAEEVVRKVYEDWWELPDEQFEPIADYISRCLTENEIEFEIYFKDAKEVD